MVTGSVSCTRLVYAQCTYSLSTLRIRTVNLALRFKSLFYTWSSSRYIFMVSKLTLAISILSFLASVRSHGYVQQVTDGANTFTGYLPYTE